MDENTIVDIYFIIDRFSLTPVYRQNPAGGQPISFSVASYDIVSPTRTLAAEAECVSNGHVKQVNQ